MFCDNCGIKIKKMGKFCQHCGHKLKLDQTRDQSEATNPPPRCTNQSLNYNQNKPQKANYPAQLYSPHLYRHTTPTGDKIKSAYIQAIHFILSSAIYSLINIILLIIGTKLLFENYLLGGLLIFLTLLFWPVGSIAALLYAASRGIGKNPLDFIEAYKTALKLIGEVILSLLIGFGIAFVVGIFGFFILLIEPIVGSLLLIGSFLIYVITLIMVLFYVIEFINTMERKESEPHSTLYSKNMNWNGFQEIVRIHTKKATRYPADKGQDKKKICPDCGEEIGEFTSYCTKCENR